MVGVGGRTRCVHPLLLLALAAAIEAPAAVASTSSSRSTRRRGTTTGRRWGRLAGAAICEPPCLCCGGGVGRRGRGVRGACVCVCVRVCPCQARRRAKQRQQRPPIFLRIRWRQGGGRVIEIPFAIHRNELKGLAAERSFDDKHEERCLLRGSADRSIDSGWRCGVEWHRLLARAACIGCVGYDIERPTRIHHPIHFHSIHPNHTSQYRSAAAQAASQPVSQPCPSQDGTRRVRALFWASVGFGFN